MNKQKIKSNRSKRIQSIRLPEYKHTKNGCYFVTICTKNCINYFGNDVVSDKVQLTPIGKIAERYFIDIHSNFKHTYIDTYMIMPNHIHGIIIINKPTNIVEKRYNFFRKAFAKKPLKIVSNQWNSLSSPEPDSLHTVIQTYKYAVNEWCYKNGYEDFQWQEKFYEGAVPPDVPVDGIRRYIINNPAKWEDHKHNPPDLWM